jgi:hypothetical protein
MLVTLHAQKRQENCRQFTGLTTAIFGFLMAPPALI